MVNIDNMLDGYTVDDEKVTAQRIKIGYEECLRKYESKASALADALARSQGDDKALATASPVLWELLKVAVAAKCALTCIYYVCETGSVEALQEMLNNDFYPLLEYLEPYGAVSGYSFDTASGSFLGKLRAKAKMRSHIRNRKRAIAHHASKIARDLRTFASVLIGGESPDAATLSSAAKRLTHVGLISAATYRDAIEASSYVKGELVRSGYELSHLGLTPPCKYSEGCKPKRMTYPE